MHAIGSSEIPGFDQWIGNPQAITNLAEGEYRPNPALQVAES